MFNRTEIMKAAWASHLSIGAETLARLTLAKRRIRFASCLRNAWDKAKSAARAARVVVVTEFERLTTAIWMLECKDRLSSQDFQELDRLRAERRAA